MTAIKKTLRRAVLCSFVLALSVAAADGPVVLVQDGQPRATIVVPNEHEHLELAVKELVDHIRKATGATLPVETEEAPVEGTRLLLGESRHTRALGIEEADLPGEGFVIRSAPGTVAIVGDTERLIDGWYRQPTKGNLWGVYRFLEKFLGIRWYLPHRLGTIIPERNTLRIQQGVRIEDAPDFPIRSFWPIMSLWNRGNREKHIELRHRRARRFATRMRGGNYYGGVQANHSVGYFVELHHDRPELFALKSDGTRALHPPNPDARRKHAQRFWHGYLDYANPETLRQMIEDHVAYYENADPEMKKLWRRVSRNRSPNEFRISFTPNDGMLASQTERARELFRSGTTGGRGKHSNYVFKFAAEFARAMHERYPRKKFVSLAYSSYALPPDMKVVGEFPPNYLVQLAVLQPMANWKEPEIYNFWSDVTREWKALGGEKMHFWQYACWPRLPKVPFFWPGLLQKFYREHRDYALGAFINGGPPGGIVGMHHLNYYFGLRVLWNVDYDIAAGLEEYCDKMYGPAAGNMHAFHRTLRRRWENVVWDLPVEQKLPGSSMLYGKDGTFPPQVVARLSNLLEEALAAPGLSEIQTERIRWIAESHRPFFDQARAIQSGNMPYHYGVRLPAAPKIDGRFNEDAWDATEWLTMNRNMRTGQTLPVGSRVKVGWREDALYLAIENDEPHMEKLDLSEKTGGRVFNDDCNEIYFDPTGTRSDHLHLMYNAAGEKLFMRVENGAGDSGWHPRGAEVVHRRLEEQWVAEMKFPLKGLGVDQIEPPARWVWNIFRHRRTGDPHYLALVPTHSRSTKEFTTYPQLLLIDRPAFYEGFDGRYEATKHLQAWHTEKRQTARFPGGLRLKNAGGRRTFHIQPGAIPEDQRKWYPRVATTLFGAGNLEIPITNQTALDLKIRWEGEASMNVQLHGRVKKGGEGKPKFFAAGLYRGKSRGKWVTAQKKLAGAGGKYGVRIETGDTLHNFSFYVQTGSGAPLAGEIERVVVGEQTILTINR